MASALELRIDTKPAEELLHGLSQKRLDAWNNYAIFGEGFEFTKLVASAYLSGQRMKVRSEAERAKAFKKGQVIPHTKDAVKPYQRKRDGVYVIRPGVGINGMQNYLERFVGTKHEFMAPAWSQFNASNRFAKAVEANLAKMLEKEQNK